jgi:hypothetical protein
MCEKCVELDKTIERYRKLIERMSDPLAIESAEKLINEAEKRKAEFHPEQKQ